MLRGAGNNGPIVTATNEGSVWFVLAHIGIMSLSNV
jgi:hypothetical protein